MNAHSACFIIFFVHLVMVDNNLYSAVKFIQVEQLQIEQLIRLTD